MGLGDILPKTLSRQSIESLFAYLFFCLFVLIVFALCVSLFSSTFAQLFLLLSQDGRIFTVFLYFFYFLGFCICFYALVAMSWGKYGKSWMFALILILSISFVFLFVFGWFGHQERISLLDLILLQEDFGQVSDVALRHFNEVFIFGFFYVFFMFLPLVCEICHLSPNLNHSLGKILDGLRPSLNLVIYALIGASLQSYFHKGHWFFYLDLVALLCGLAMLVWVVRCRRKPHFFEVCNLSFLFIGLIVFAFSSKILHEANFNARYALFAFVWVAWCGEWVFGILNQNQAENLKR